KGATSRAFRSWEPVAMTPAVGGCLTRQIERDVPERPGSEDRPLGSCDLPVEARVGLAESRGARLMRQDERPRVSALQRCRDLLDLDCQLGVEPPFDVGTEERGQQRAGRPQRERDPDDRADEQPEAE